MLAQRAAEVRAVVHAEHAFGLCHGGCLFQAARPGLEHL
jgi:hypothetical protein